MAEEKSGVGLPTELITEKTFYTLGGASVAVLLTCWVIMFIAGDAIPAKGYRGIGLGLSMLFAIIIMLNKKDRKPIKWLFAFLNGLLIFVNASGFNTITASSVFDAKNTSKTSLIHQNKGNFQLAGLIPLPKMINWWPDEEMVKQNADLQKENGDLKGSIIKLDASNKELTLKLNLTADEKQNLLNDEIAQLKDSIASMQNSLDEKNKKIEALETELAASKGKSPNEGGINSKKYFELQKQLEIKKSDLLACNNDKITLNKTISGLKMQLRQCQSGLIPK